MTPFKILTNTLTRLDFDHIDGRAAWGNRGLYQFLSELHPEMAPLLGDDEDFEADGLEPPTPEARAAGERDHAALDAAWRLVVAAAADAKIENLPSWESRASYPEAMALLGRAVALTRWSSSHGGYWVAYEGTPREYGVPPGRRPLVEGPHARPVRVAEIRAAIAVQGPAALPWGDVSLFSICDETGNSTGALRDEEIAHLPAEACDWQVYYARDGRPHDNPFVGEPTPGIVPPRRRASIAA